MISYSQNFEDVILWRAFKHIEVGFYIDIGAQDPVIDSVSLSFYEAGWRGVHVEPTPFYAQALRDARPDETVVQAAIGDGGALLSFFEFPGTGISTGDASISRRHETAGFSIKKIEVPCIRLSSLLDKYGDRDIHWMKIDVEGMELSVLRSWVGSKTRPWVVVLESTLPLSQEQSYAEWEALILELGYSFVYFDGLNRFYLSVVHSELLPAFSAPPNVFDSFSLSGTGSHTFCNSLKDALAHAKQDAADIAAQERVHTEQIRGHEVKLAESKRLLEEQVKASEALAEHERRLTEQAQAHEAHLAESARLLSEQVQANGEQMRMLKEHDAAKETERLRLIDELAAVRHEAALGQARAMESVQSVVKDLVSEQRVAIESLIRSASERESGITIASQMLEQDLRSELARLRSSQGELHALVDQLQAQLDIVNKSWLRKFLGSRSEPLPRPRQWNANKVETQSIQGPDTNAAYKVHAGNVLKQQSSFSALQTDQATSSSKESLRINMPNESLHSDIATNRPNLDALLEHHGVAFLHHAYLAILRRPPDAEGTRFFLGELESGVSKLLVLRNLVESDEAKIRDLNNIELSAEIQRRMPGWISLRGKISQVLGRGKRSSSIQLDALLARHGHDFVNSAYRVLLRREPDQSGIGFYTDELLSGHSKIDILGQIYNSAERRALGTSIPGLSDRLRQQRLARMPIIGSAVRRRQADGYAASDFLMRRIDQRVGLLSDGIGTLLAEIQRHNERLERRLSKISDGLQHQPSGHQHTRDQQSLDDRVRSHGSRAENASFEHSGALRRSVGGTPLPPIVFFFVDHTIQCPVNTGMQRVVRRLGRALIERGQRIVFVKWNASIKELMLVDQEDLAYLGKWNGPQFTKSQLGEYPHRNQTRSVKREKITGSWLLVPEVTHITYHEQPVTLDLLLTARRLNLAISFIYYDAIPLRLPSYKETAHRHEQYMQQLLLADLVIPISERSAKEIGGFFHAYQSSTSPRPTVYALSLPAESQLTSRQYKISNSTETGGTILCVGSIEPRKNQITMLEAFESLSERKSDFPWKLVLAGNLRGDVAAKVMEIIGRNKNISHVQNIPDPELDALYRSCSFTVFPSIEEGFGLPILESLWYSKPCICANFGAMAEVAAGGGCYAVNTRTSDDLLMALEAMTSDAELRSRLSSEASNRSLSTWSDYSSDVIELLQRNSDPVHRIGRIYYWVDNTAINTSNSGIQRVTRQLAKALIGLGANLIPVRWDASKQQLVEASKPELDHMALWAGPSPDGWTPWMDPVHEAKASWLLVPELTHGQLGFVKDYAKNAGLRCAAIFYDSIPFKFSAEYGLEFGKNHRAYMLELFGFDAVFPISEYSRQDLLTFYIAKTDIREIGLDQRIRTQLLPDEFPSGPRQQHPESNASNSFRLLSVLSMEPRKNILTLLTAFQYAQSRTKVNLQLTLVGRRIPAFAELADEVERRIGNMEHVVWEQGVNDVRLDELYRLSDFTVFPSLEEGYGLPIVESLWNGRPCICHNQGAMLEVASGGGCVLVDMHDADLLADSIVSFVESSTMRSELGRQACSRQARSWTNYGSDMLHALAKLSPQQKHGAAAKVSDIVAIYNELPNLKPRPLLTIAISTYNRAGWLGVALRNLERLIPTPRSDVEILVCDNFSTDNTPDVVSPYRSREDFTYIRNPENVGMLGNLKITSNSARGDFVWILGDDDLPFSGSIDRIIGHIRANPDAALVYLNYTYTRETDPSSVRDIEVFLASGAPVAASTPDRVAAVKDIATVNENLFTAIYCIIFRRDHALRAYCQDTSGRPFSTMLTSIPTTSHVLNSMMDETAVWIGDPQVLVNFNVSWNSYASLQILERVPEALDLAELNGANPSGIDKLRKNLIPGYIHYFNEIFGEDKMNNHEFFSILRVISRIRHLDVYETIAPSLAKIYENAYDAGHPAAKIKPSDLFGKYLELVN